MPRLKTRQGPLRLGRGGGSLVLGRPCRASSYSPFTRGRNPAAATFVRVYLSCRRKIPVRNFIGVKRFCIPSRAGGLVLIWNFFPRSGQLQRHRLRRLRAVPGPLGCRDLGPKFVSLKPATFLRVYSFVFFNGDFSLKTGGFFYSGSHRDYWEVWGLLRHRIDVLCRAASIFRCFESV